MAENEANQANYEELAGHISILGAKLKQAMPETQSARLEDLEDHYERALQMRVMHNNTLVEELKEERKKIESLSSKIGRFKFMAAFGLVVTACVVAVILYPDKVEKLLVSTELWTHLLLFISAVYITKRVL
jgi:predicted RNase H-like nuclease (RuvC/YqgF family)|tara:strand:+ start:206 stop:598 length:393 start_codon:yes stop_codon:yes gene_type:complete